MIINSIELASNLAHNRTIIEVIEVYPEWEEEDFYEKNEENTLTYKDFVQDIFNKWYDYYFTEISKTEKKD